MYVQYVSTHVENVCISFMFVFFYPTFWGVSNGLVSELKLLFSLFCKICLQNLWKSPESWLKSLRVKDITKMNTEMSEVQINSVLAVR